MRTALLAAWLSLLLVATASAARPPEAIHDALSLLTHEPVAEDADPCESPGETRVFKLPPTPELERLMLRLLDDPVAIPLDKRTVSVVLVTRPLPCGERLRAARVELWDSLALERRGPVARFFFRLRERFGSRDPALSALLFADDDAARRAGKRYRLVRVLEFKSGDPWMGTINGHGVVVFPAASNSVSGATLTFKTEKLVRRKSGKRPRRVRGQHNADSFALPAPDDPVADPAGIRRRLGIDR